MKARSSQADFPSAALLDHECPRHFGGTCEGLCIQRVMGYTFTWTNSRPRLLIFSRFFMSSLVCFPMSFMGLTGASVTEYIQTMNK